MRKLMKTYWMSLGWVKTNEKIATSPADNGNDSNEVIRVCQGQTQTVLYIQLFDKKCSL